MNKVKEHEFLLFSKDKIIKTIGTASAKSD